MMPTAIEIYKLLPKTNCGKCGFPTCLAFAMQIAAGKKSVDECPDVDPKAKETLAEAAAPPIPLVKVGGGDNPLEIGDETVIFRHEKAFFHPTAIALLIDSSMPEEEIERKVKEFDEMAFERVGQTLTGGAIAIKEDDPGKFSGAIEAVKRNSSKPLILMGKSAVIAEAAKKLAGEKPLLHCSNSLDFEAMVSLAKEVNAPLAVRTSAETAEEALKELASMSQAAKDKGVKEVVADLGSLKMNEMLQALVAIRRLAIKKKFRPLGLPVMFSLGGMGDRDALMASLGVLKYASIIVIPEVDRQYVYPLLALRQNIFTDPRVPLQVEEGVYEIGAPNDSSPVLLTSNFSLTYFNVAGDTESSKVPSYIVVTYTEGLSVMTAFAAGKLTPESVKKTLDEVKVDGRVNHKKMIIPGMIARMSGKLEEITGWEIMVGPRESTGIPKYLKENWR
jgi:acetyl-CoA decarbonylase/synthase complex subunit gamma